MEIMTTWNTDFEFDLQRFAVDYVKLSDISTLFANGDAASDVYVDPDTGTVAKTAVTSDYVKLGNVSTYSSAGASTIGISNTSFKIVADEGTDNWTVNNSDTKTAITVQDDATGTNSVSLAASKGVTFTTNFAAGFQTTSKAVTVTAGSAKIVNLTSGTATEVGYGDSKTITITTDNNINSTTVKKDGSVTAFSTSGTTTTFTTTEALSITNAVGTYTLNGTAAIKQSDGTATLTAGAVVSGVANGMVMTTGATGEYTVNGTKVKPSVAVGLDPTGVADGTNLTVTGLTSTKTLEVTAVADASKGAALTFGTAAWTGISTGVVFNGATDPAQTAELDAAGETVTIGGYTVTGTSTNAIEVNNTGVVTATAGETFIITQVSTGSSKVFTWYNDSIVKVNIDGTMRYIKKNGLDQYNWTLAGATDADAVAIKTNLVSSSTKTYNALGLEEANATAAVIDATTSTKKVTVNEQIGNAGSGGVSTLTDTVQVIDKGTNTKYTLADDSVVTANGVTFTATNGVVSDASNTITIDGATNNLKAKGTVNVNASALTTGTVTYVAGSKVEAAKIALSATKVITLTEDNSVKNATDTVITAAGAISGLEGDATIKTEGLTAATTFNTVSDGTFVFNGTSFTVADDGNGATFTTGTTTATYNTVASVSGLATGATVTTGALSAIDLSVGGSAPVAFTGITAKNGVKFTANSQTTTSIQLLSKGDTFTSALGTTYTVEAMGSGSNYITVAADGTITGLDDGDVLKAATGASDYIEYSVSGGVLASKEYTTAAGGLASTNSYTLNEGEENGFTVSRGSVNPVNGTSGSNTAGSITVGTTPIGSLSDGVYINADGTTSTSADKAIAQVSVSDDTITYQATGNKAQTVAISGDTATKQNWVVNTGAGKDEIAVTAGTADVTISSGTGKDEINLAGTSTGDKTVTVGDGSSKVTLGGSGDINLTLGSGNDTVTTSGAPAGDIVITANSGNNSINLAGATGDVTINGGSGNDTITAASKDNVVTGGDGKDVFNIGTGITISDYSFGNDVIQVGAGVTPAPAMLTSDGKISVAAGVADISANAGDFYAADIKIGTNKAIHTAWAKEGGSNIDISSYSENVVVKGDADGVNTLYTGTGNDTILSQSEKDSVFGGAGKDYVTLTSGLSGRTVGIATTSGKDTVAGFTAKFDEGDSLFMVDGDTSGVKASYSGTTLTFKDGSGVVDMTGITTQSSGAAELVVSGTKLAVAAKNAKVSVSSASYANAFFGDSSAVDFTQTDSDLNINLGNGITGDTSSLMFNGIASVTGGSGKNTLIGSAKADYIVAGTGTSSLYGGAGKDTLVGSGESDMFFFGDGTNTNTIKNFVTADNETADTVKVLGSIAGAKLDSSTVVLSTADGSKAEISGVSNLNSNSKIKVEADNFTGVAKLGESSKANNFTYDKDVSYYGGGSASDKISVASGFSDNANIWLDGSQGVAYGSIDVVDFSNGSGNYVIAGDSSKNTIVGGKGDSSLWGGAGNSADSLKGGSGNNLFFWGTGEGNDSISSSNADDTVNLYTVKLSDVDVANSSITNSGVVLALNDGSKLTVSTSKDINFTVDGTSWTAVHSTKSWKQNS